jgi:hypothetical protein
VRAVRPLTCGPKPLEVRDQGTFYVGGAPKVTAFGNGPTPGAYSQIIIGSMYVQFQTPMKTKSWPVILVHGSGYTGSCVQGTAGGTESWADYMLRQGIPTYVVDQAGRGRSGFDKSVFHEGEFLIDTDPAAAHALLPTLGGFHSTNWDAFYGHTIPAGADITTGQSYSPWHAYGRADRHFRSGRGSQSSDLFAFCRRSETCACDNRFRGIAKFSDDQAFCRKTRGNEPLSLGTANQLPTWAA